MKKALLAVDGVAEVSAESKADTGGHPNKVVVKGSVTEDAVRAALVALDAGRGKFTVADAGAEASATACEDGLRAAREVPNSAAELGFTTYVYKRAPVQPAATLSADAALAAPEQMPVSPATRRRLRASRCRQVRTPSSKTCCGAKGRRGSTASNASLRRGRTRAATSR